MDVFFSSVLLGAGLLSDNFSKDGLTSPFPLIPRAILPVTAIGVSKDDLFGWMHDGQHIVFRIPQNHSPSWDGKI